MSWSDFVRLGSGASAAKLSEDINKHGVLKVIDNKTGKTFVVTTEGKMDDFEKAANKKLDSFVDRHLDIVSKLLDMKTK